MSLQRALELAEDAKHRAYPKPTVGAVVVSGGATVGEGVTEAGADLLVAGTSIFGADDLAHAYRRLVEAVA